MKEVTLRAIEKDDIQLIRYWRNLKHVRERMVMQNLIERDGQRQWFENLDTTANKYFIYSLLHRDVGCVNCVKINWAELTFEGGVFCGDLDYLNHWVNILACIKLYDYAFDELDLKVSYATILLDNPAALNLNKHLGYTQIKEGEKNIGKFELTKDRYKEHSRSVRRYFASKL